MSEIAQVRDIMTKEVLSVSTEDTLDVIAQLFEKYDYDGLPVTDAKRKVVGIVTGYDMIVQSSGMHLPTVLSIMQKVDVQKGDKKDLNEHFSKIRRITAKEIMNANPLVIPPDMTLDEVARVFAEHHRVNPLIVVDDGGTLAGVVSRYDVIRFFNERYFQQLVQEKPMYRKQRAEERVPKERELNETVGDFSDEFLFVTKRRPRIWRYVAIGAFIAGLVAATALIIRIVRQADGFGGDIIHTTAIVRNAKVVQLKL